MKRNRIFFLLGNLSKILYKGNKKMASSLQSRIKQNILCKNGTEPFSRQDSRLLFFSAYGWSEMYGFLRKESFNFKFLVSYDVFSNLVILNQTH
jgi:hypothetical protein